MFLPRGSERDPDGPLAIFNVRGNFVKRSVVRHHLVAHIVAEHLDRRVSASIIPRELSDKCSPLAWLNDIFGPFGFGFFG
jgi:hypothetical protein